MIHGQKAGQHHRRITSIETGDTPRDDGRFFFGSNREPAAVGRDGKAVTLVTGGLLSSTGKLALAALPPGHPGSTVCFQGGCITFRSGAAQSSLPVSGWICCHGVLGT